MCWAFYCEYLAASFKSDYEPNYNDAGDDDGDGDDDDDVDDDYDGNDGHLVETALCNLGWNVGSCLDWNSQKIPEHPRRFYFLLLPFTHAS